MSRRGLARVGCFLLLNISATCGTTLAAGPDEIRSTVQLRSGQRRGSGTVIASTTGSTLILTAAHVVRDAREVQVEIHRHNLGHAGLSLTEGGGWPRLVSARVLAADPATDVAVVQIRDMVALPYICQFDPDAEEPAKGEAVTSVGIDRTLHLTRWRTSVQGWATIDIGQGGGARRFTVTERPPEHGRSGGGLFRADGTVVGVCTGRASPAPGKPEMGLFASLAAVRQLLEDHGLTEAISRAKARAPQTRSRPAGTP
ncbi:MAG: serine protease [Isosphaeraceae bacterium]